MKVVWLCHFANQEMKDYFHTQKVREMAPWINNLIELFRTQKDVDLHIVAPNVFTNRDCFFVKEGISYHFYATRSIIIPEIVNRFLRKYISLNTLFLQNKISKIIKEIKPDIIHLHGAENPYYSAGIIPLFGKYPVLLTIQGFIRNSSVRSKKVKYNIAIEEEIIKKTIHYGTRTKEMDEIILSLNPKAQLHYHSYPLTIPQYIKNDKSTYDIVFFAGVSKDKGIEDLFRALALVKNEKQDISLHIIGAIGMYYKHYLLNMIESLSINKNVIWVGFIENQQDVFKYAVNAKICVLPTHHDIIPGTILESMFMKLPVIAYSVGGIPELNKKEETIILVEKQNINHLAEKIAQLLNNSDFRNTLAEKAYIHVNERINNNNVVPDILNAYESVLKDNTIL